MGYGHFKMIGSALRMCRSGSDIFRGMKIKERDRGIKEEEIERKKNQEKQTGKGKE